MMTFDQVSAATLEELTDELAAAGLNPGEIGLEEARENVARLLSVAGPERIRRNADGQQNLVDLRRVLSLHTTRTVRKQGHNWITGVFSGGCWHESTCPYYWGERQAIQSVLFGEVEMADEVAAPGLDLRKTSRR